MAAALDVHDPCILHAIEKVDVQNVTNTIKTLDLLANQSMDTITEITLALNKLTLRHDTTSSDIQNIPALFNFSSFSFNEEVIDNIYNLNKKIISLIDELKWASPQKAKIKTLYDDIKAHSNLYSFQIKLSFPQLQPIFDSFENARSFIVDIEQYQLLSNNSYLTFLIKSLDNLQPYTTTIETLSNSERIPHITEQFDDLNKLIKKKVNISDKYTILRLSGGTEGREMFLEEFDDKSDLRPTAQSFVVNGLALSEKIQSLPFGEKQFIAQAGKEFKSMNQSIPIFFTKIEALNSKFLNEGQSLKSLGKLSSVLDQINVSAFHLPLMISALNKLKSTSIGQSKEVADFEKSLEQLEDLQFAIMRKKGILSLLLGETETFLKLFFAKQMKSETDSER
uniref:Uncharacterized protein n=1 Tax=Caenorhabditis japonica TaxID=281687 RepID=A0A8R1E5U6_CAEJA